MTWRESYPAMALFPVIFLFVLFSCPAAEKKPLLGVCAMGTRHPYFQEMLDEIGKEAARAGVDVVQGDADFDLARQTQIIDGYIERRVDMIMVAPFDAAGLMPALERAKQAGIPVMTVDAAAPGFPVVSHCASDNTAGGRLAAGIMLERLNDLPGGQEGVVLVLDHAGVSSTARRVKGFSDVMALRGGHYEVRVIDGVGQTSFASDRSLRIMEELGDRLVAVFSSNDGMTVGVLDALEKIGRVGEMVVVGYDYTAELARAVDDGDLYGIVVQFPRRIGAAAFKIAYDYLTGKDRAPPPIVLIEVGTYTAEGLQDQRGNPIE